MECWEVKDLYVYIPIPPYTAMYRLDPWHFVMEFDGCFNNHFAFSSHTCNWEMLSWPVVAMCRYPLLHKFVEPPVFQWLCHDLMHMFAFQAAFGFKAFR